MRIRNPVGLVAAGGVNRSFVARLPALMARLGPVKASSLRLSRRIANQLRAGAGVADYAQLQDCSMIWIFGPENTLDRVTADLARHVRLDGKMVVLAEVIRDSRWPGPLRASGAKVATLNCVPSSGERLFVAEGSREAIGEVRKLLGREGRKVISLRAGSKTLYLSGVFAAGHLLMPWISGAVESFRAAGFSRSEATGAVQTLGEHALRAYAKGGAKSWNRGEAELLYRAIEADIETVRLSDHRLAALYADHGERLLRPLAKKPASKRLQTVVALRAS